MQVFQLSILPGTAFRREASQLGLVHQDRPPYAVLRTPSLELDAMRMLVEEAEAVFGTSFDPLPDPWLGAVSVPLVGVASSCVIDFDAGEDGRSLPNRIGAVFALHLRSRDPFEHLPAMVNAVRAVVADDPFTTLLIVVEAALEFPFDVLDALRAAAVSSERVYIDRYHEWTPGSPVAARRIAIALPDAARATLDPDWVEAVTEAADVVWMDPASRSLVPG